MRTIERGAIGSAGGNAACEGPRSRSSVAIASAKRSTTPWLANGLVRPRRPARSPPRTQRSAKASASKAARSTFETGDETQCELHRGRTIEPDPDRMRGLPLALAHECSLLTRGTTPVNSRRRLAGKKRAKLPECFARAGSPPTMNAMPHRLRHTAGRNQRLGRRAESVAASRRMEAGGVISSKAAQSLDRLGHKPSNHR